MVVGDEDDSVALEPELAEPELDEPEEPEEPEEPPSPPRPPPPREPRSGRPCLLKLDAEPVSAGAAALALAIKEEMASSMPPDDLASARREVSDASQSTEPLGRAAEMPEAPDLPDALAEPEVSAPPEAPAPRLGMP